MDEREKWDTGEPAARSHEQYRAPETVEPQAQEVVGNPPLVSEQDEGDVTPDESSDESGMQDSSDGDAGLDSDDSES